jgi:hypothetical protein
MSQQIHVVREYNPATKQGRVIARYLVSRSRKHGRSRRFGKVVKIRRLPDATS